MMTTVTKIQPNRFLGKVPAWRGYLLAASVLTAGYFLLPALGSIGAPIQVFVYGAVSLSSAIAVVAGVRRNRPAHRPALAPWLLIAAGQGLTASGEVVFDVLYQLLDSQAEVSPADALYLAAYPLLAAGLLMLVRRRTPGWDMPSIIDA